ncbi:MAG: helix-turn-helix transcriptional regulator [Kiritimatiellae bacterium]|nr:helix-turn-helix transcriptional regulator [Kiritimatiellia bacterium]
MQTAAHNDTFDDSAGHPLWLIPPSAEKEPGKVERALGERIKELNCLYAISRVAELHPDSLEAFMENVVMLLPPSWQFPELTEAAIRFRGSTYKTAGYRAMPWMQAAPVFVQGENVGEVIVVYTQRCPAAVEGPFLREERALLNAVAERIGMAAARMDVERELQETNRQLEVERKALAESNIALRGVLARIEDEKRDIARDVQTNVERILMPIIHALMLRIPTSDRKYVELLRDNLEDLVSPFVNQLTQRYASLTPTEVRICDMIRRGMQTKDIAALRGVSAATISRHREHIRRKLGVTNTTTNLTTLLQSYQTPQDAVTSVGHA